MFRMFRRRGRGAGTVCAARRALCTLASSRGCQDGLACKQCISHGADMSFGPRNRKSPQRLIRPRARPVAIAPGRIDRRGRPLLRHRIISERPARPAAQEPRERHPAAWPDPVPRHALCPIFRTGGLVPAARPEGHEDRAQRAFVDPQKGISRAATKRCHGANVSLVPWQLNCPFNPPERSAWILWTETARIAAIFSVPAKTSASADARAFDFMRFSSPEERKTDGTFDRPVQHMRGAC